MSYYIYILLCKNDKLYTGIARDPEKRFLLHQKNKGAKFTQKNKPIRIVYKEEHKTLSEASKRECEIKKLSRKEKEQLIGRKK